jgi:hypothetical protein
MHELYVIIQSDYPLSGLHRHMTPRTANEAMLPQANPPTRQKLATVAAVSTSSLRPFNRGFLSAFGAAIMHSVLTHPFVSPKARRMSMKPASGIAPADGKAPGVWTLQRRKRGMKMIRAAEMAKSRGPDQIRRDGNEQSRRPPKSPMLNIRKWVEVKIRGCVAGFSGRTATVMGGNTA